MPDSDSGCLFVHRERHDHDTLLVLRGSLDQFGAATLTRMLEHLDLTDRDHLVLDLSGLEQVCDRGTTVIESLQQRCRAGGVALEILSGRTG